MPVVSPVRPVASMTNGIAIAEHQGRSLANRSPIQVELPGSAPSPQLLVLFWFQYIGPGMRARKRPWARPLTTKDAFLDLRPGSTDLVASSSSTGVHDKPRRRSKAPSVSGHSHGHGHEECHEARGQVGQSLFLNDGSGQEVFLRPWPSKKPILVHYECWQEGPINMEVH